VALNFDQILALVAQEAGKGEAKLLAPLVRSRKGIYVDLFARLKRLGFTTVLVDGEWLPLDPVPSLERHREHDIELLVASLGGPGAPAGELPGIVRRALTLGNGSLHLYGEERRVFSERLYCDHCRQGLEPLDPRLFSFNSRHGACPSCAGAGTIERLNIERLIGPAGSRIPLKEGLSRFLEATSWPDGAKLSVRRLRHYWTETLRVDWDSSFHDLPQDVQTVMLRGKAGESLGLLPLLRKVAEAAPGGALEALHEEHPCPECQGRRLNAQARAVTIRGLGIADLAHLNLTDFQKQWRAFRFTPQEQPIANPISREIQARAAFLHRVGLAYLALDRSGDTLSGGETQRIRLAAQLGSNLSGVLYILDEPTIGLHARDNEQLLAALEQLKARGNSVLVVEHDEATMRRADYIIDLGPGPGRHGGEVVAAGTLAELRRHPESITGQCLRTKRSFPARGQRRAVGKARRPAPEPGWLTLRGARKNNLKNLTVSFPLGRLVVVTGVSGSGKSTLVRECLLPALQSRRASRAARRTSARPRLSGAESLHAVYEVDQSPIGRTPRSIPATYVGFFDDIRRLFAQAPEARLRGYSPSRFSFNSAQGRCPECEGAGTIKLEMNFLPPAFVRCEVCGGTRFNRETLDIEYHGRNIAAVLEMSVEEAREFFGNLPRLRRPLQALCDTGLGYLKLGQTSPTLSGGEAQRVKLVSHLLSGLKTPEALERRPRRNLFVLEEPTIGLHMADVRRLVDVLQRLVEAGHSVIVIEHNLDLIAEADWVIDLGPEGGDGGGRVVAAGTPEQVARCRLSHTGRFLRGILAPA